MSEKSDPVNSFKAITPSDTVDLDYRTAGIYCGASGDVVLMGDDGIQATFTVATGVILPVYNIKRVMATGTTATNLVAFID